MLGKLNMDEFAMGSSNSTSIYGPAVNPWRKKKILKNLHLEGHLESASSVAADLCIASLEQIQVDQLATASFNGIVGLKPTYGRCSRWE